jgi:hypothetical protein
MVDSPLRCSVQCATTLFWKIFARTLEKEVAMSVISRCLLVVLFGLAAAGVANADYISDDNFMPCLTLQSQPGTIVAYPNNIWARNFKAQSVGERAPLHSFSNGWTTAGSSMDISFEYSTDGGQSWQSSGVKHSYGFLDFMSVGQNSYSTALGIDDVWGTNGVIIGTQFGARGYTTIEPYGDKFRISSYSDVNTWLSVDNRQTRNSPTGISTDYGAHWQSGNLPFRLEGVPEPGTLALLATSGAALLWWRRRRPS